MLSDLRSRCDRMVGARNELQRQVDEKQKACTGLSADADRHRQAVALIEALGVAARKQVANGVTKLATGAMADIFGPTAGCELEYEQYGERGAFRPVFSAWDQDGIRANPMAGMGGSAAQIIGTALRVLFLIKSRGAPFIFLDEPVDGVDGINVEAVAVWLRQLCDDLGIQIIVISHLGEEIFEEAADRILRVRREGNESLVEVLSGS